MRTMLMLLCFAVTAKGQPPEVEWTRTYGGTGDDACTALQQTLDGCFILAGHTNSFGSGGNDFWLLKIDANGDTVWTRTFGGLLSEWASAVQQTSDSGFALAGKTRSFGSGESDMWLVKTNANGDSLWSRTYGTPWLEAAHGMQQTHDDGYILAGFRSVGYAPWYVWIVRASSSGDSVWSRHYPIFWYFGFTEAFGVEETDDEGYVLTGGDDDMWLLKTDAVGDSQWSHAYLGEESGERSYAIQQTADGGYIMAGQSTLGAGNWDIGLVKTNGDGDLEWNHTFGGPDFEYAYAVMQTPDGGYAVAGSTTSFGSGGADMWLVRTGAGGDSLWSLTYGGNTPEQANAVRQTLDGGYVMAGYTGAYPNRDILIVKTTPFRPMISVTPVELDFAQIPVGDSASSAIGIQNVGPDGLLIITDVVSPVGFASNFGSGELIIAPGESEIITMTFVPTEAREYDDTLFIYSNAADSVAMVRLSGTGVANAADDVPIAPREYALHPVYPNPFNAVAEIRFDVPVTSHVRLKVYDVLGKEARTPVDGLVPAGTHRITLDAAGLPSGVYLCLFKAGHYSAVQKLMLLK